MFTKSTFHMLLCQDMLRNAKGAFTNQKFHFTSNDLTSTDLISSEPSALRLVAATANWVASKPFGADEMRSAEMKSCEVRWYL